MRRPRFRFVLFLALSLALPNFPGCVSFQSSHPPDDPAWNELVAGIRSYEEGRYVAAIGRFRRIIETYPGSPLLGEAQWLLAKSYYAAREREAAARALRDFLRNDPKGAHEEEARILLAQMERSDQTTLAFYWHPRSERSFQDRILAFQKRGVNTLLVPGFENAPGRSGLYFRAGDAPLLEDRLGEWIQSAHRAGLRLIVEAPVREMAWAIRSHPEWRDQKYDPRKGGLAPADRLDLFNPEVRAMILRLYRALSKYPVDGIYIRSVYYGREEGWTPAALRLYRDLFSEALDPAAALGASGSASTAYPSAPSFWRWVGWRSRFIRDFLGEIRMEVELNRPNLEWGVGLPALLTLDPLKGLAEFSGDLLELKQFPFDFYLLTSEAASAPLGALSAKISQYAIPPERVWIEAPRPSSGAAADLDGETYTSIRSLSSN